MSDKVSGYWKLYCKVFSISICRKCGVRLDESYQKRKQGNLCIECYSKRGVKSQ